MGQETTTYNRDHMQPENKQQMIAELVAKVSGLSDNDKKQYVADTLCILVDALPQIFNTPATAMFATSVGYSVKQAVTRMTNASRIINPFMAQAAPTPKLEVLAKFRKQEDAPVLNAETVANSDAGQSILNDVQLAVLYLEGDGVLPDMYHTFSDQTLRAALNTLGMADITTTEPELITLDLLAQGREKAKFQAAQREAVNVANENVIVDQPKLESDGQANNTQAQESTVEGEATPLIENESGDNGGKKSESTKGGKKS